MELLKPRLNGPIAFYLYVSWAWQQSEASDWREGQQHLVVIVSCAGMFDCHPGGSGVKQKAAFYHENPSALGFLLFFWKWRRVLVKHVAPWRSWVSFAAARPQPLSLFPFIPPGGLERLLPAVSSWVCHKWKNGGWNLWEMPQVGGRRDKRWTVQAPKSQQITSITWWEENNSWNVKLRRHLIAKRKSSQKQNNHLNEIDGCLRGFWSLNFQTTRWPQPSAQPCIMNASQFQLIIGIDWMKVGKFSLTCLIRPCLTLFPFSSAPLRGHHSESSPSSSSSSSSSLSPTDYFLLCCYDNYWNYFS